MKKAIIHKQRSSVELLEENRQLKAELEEYKKTSENYWRHILWLKKSKNMKMTIAPCPLCGSEHVALGGSISSREFFVMCYDCDAIGPTHRSERIAILAWNKGDDVIKDDFKEDPINF